MHISLRQPIARRHFLKAGAVSLALPALNAMLPRGLRAAESASPKRLLLIGRNLGLHAPFFFPETPGSATRARATCGISTSIAGDSPSSPASRTFATTTITASPGSSPA